VRFLDMTPGSSLVQPDDAGTSAPTNGKLLVPTDAFGSVVPPSPLASAGPEELAPISGAYYANTPASLACLYEQRPFYQFLVKDIVGSLRDSPDVAAVADPFTGVRIYDTNLSGWLVVGGTSVSTPVWAGIVNAAGRFNNSTAAEFAQIYASPFPFPEAPERVHRHHFRCLRHWRRLRGPVGDRRLGLLHGRGQPAWLFRQMNTEITEPSASGFVGGESAAVATRLVPIGPLWFAVSA
jgi:hypothetical protein